MKILVYCQHVVGVGHFFRTLELCRALRGHEVVLVLGGKPVAAALPRHVRCTRLPGLEMDPDFSALHAPGTDARVESVMAERAEKLMGVFRTEKPDAFLVELYPFGRKAFRFELDPVLQSIAAGELSRARVICSVRDILVEKKDPEAYEARVVQTLNRYFDGVLIHGDPKLIRLEETFSRLRDIRAPAVYTGYVAARPDTESVPELRSRAGMNPDDVWMVASAGGGRVGFAMLTAVAGGFELLAARNPRIHLHMFTGPYLPEAEYRLLRRRSGPRFRVARFTDAFAELLAAADLSVSMGGYNTCMNVLAAGVRSLMVPFGQNREQGMRLARLAAKGAVRMLPESELSRDAMADALLGALAAPRPKKDIVDLNGAAASASWIERWVRGETEMRT